MQEKNFKHPKTGEEFAITYYRIVIRTSGTVYKDKHGRALVADDGEELIPIERNRGIPTAILGDNQTRLIKHQKYFGKRAKKHANSIDQKINKRDAFRKEMGRYKKNQKL